MSVRYRSPFGAKTRSFGHKNRAPSPVIRFSSRPSDVVQMIAPSKASAIQRRSLPSIARPFGRRIVWTIERRPFPIRADPAHASSLRPHFDDVQRSVRPPYWAFRLRYVTGPCRVRHACTWVFREAIARGGQAVARGGASFLRSNCRMDWETKISRMASLKHSKWELRRRTSKSAASR